MTQTQVRFSGSTWQERPAAELYRLSLNAFHAALEAANPARLVKKHVKLNGDVLAIRRLEFHLDRYDRIFILGGGKATGAMAAEVERLLGERVVDGAVNIPDYIPRLHLKRVRPHYATHPYPAEAGVAGVRAMIRLADRTTPQDLIICLFSGGGSALMPAPADGVDLADKVATTDLLLKCGAQIGEMNVVRRHLSSFKGGRLAERLSGSTVVSLIISDVPGDRLDTVSSGPTAPDATTFAQARRVLEKYHIWKKAPARVRNFIGRGEKGEVPETPKPGSPVFRNVHNILIGSNRDARQASYAYLRRAGVDTELRDGFFQGEASKTGETLVRQFLKSRPRILSRPHALVAGGEATVKVKGSGVGGRDQELVLAAARGLTREGLFTFAALATDGVDGPTGAAGAIADGTTLRRGQELGLSSTKALRDNDSNTYFRRLGDLLLCAPTGTNVNDIVVAIAFPSGNRVRC